MNARVQTVVGALIFFSRAARHIATLTYVRQRYPKSSSAVAGAAGTFLTLVALGFPPTQALTPPVVGGESGSVGPADPASLIQTPRTECPTGGLL